MKINPPQKANVGKSSLYGWLPTWEIATVGCRVQAVLWGGSLQSKLKSPRFEVFTFSSTCCLQCISIEKDFLWFSESLSPVQMLVAASGTNLPQSTIKCKLKMHNFPIQYKFATAGKTLFIAKSKSIATSYHDITITVTIDNFICMSYPFILNIITSVVSVT